MKLLIAPETSVLMCISSSVVPGSSPKPVNQNREQSCLAVALFVFGRISLRNFSRGIGYLNYGSSWLFSVPSRESWYSTSIRPWRLRSKSFPVPQPSYHPTLYSLDTDIIDKERTLKTSYLNPWRGYYICVSSAKHSAFVSCHVHS
jgi:hypothetical protein